MIDLRLSGLSRAAEGGLAWQTSGFYSLTDQRVSEQRVAQI